jgi:hypothetical protein
LTALSRTGLRKDGGVGVWYSMCKLLLLCCRWWWWWRAQVLEALASQLGLEPSLLANYLTGKQSGSEAAPPAKEGYVP